MSIVPPDNPFEPDWDVIVIGSGAAGLTASVFAALEGARVLVLERTEFVGGTSALSAGSVWIPNTPHAAAVGIQDSVEEAGRFLDIAVGNRSPKPMRDAFLRLGPEAVRRLEGEAGLKFRSRPFHPDYLYELEGSKNAGRAIEALPFDGGALGADLRFIRPAIPEFTVLGGMMVDRDDIGHLLNITKSLSSFTYGVKLIARYAMDRLRHGRGARMVMGNALVGRLLKAALDRGVTIAPATEVIDVGGDTAGRTVTVRRNGTEHTMTAAGGVIFASGGFARHPERRKEFLPDPVPEWSPAAPGNTATLHDIAAKLGAVYGDSAAQPVFWAPMSRRRRKDGSMAVFPHFVLDRSKPGIFCVGRDGRRFVNESTSYHKFVIAQYAADRDGSTIPAYEIADAAALRKYGLGMVRPGGRGLGPYLADGYLTRADTLEELAGKLGVDPQGLIETAAAMNRYAETGVDEAFQRGSTVYECGNGDPEHKPNPTLGPVGTAPFYAIKLWPGEIGSATGLLTDTEARVLDRDGQVLEGLYACGNDMQSIMGGVYPGPGINLGPAITFGSVAGKNAATRLRKEH